MEIDYYKKYLKYKAKYLELQKQLGGVVYEKLGMGFYGCVYKVTADSGEIFVRKVSHYSTQNTRELDTNKLLLEYASIDQTLHEHFIIMKDYRIVEHSNPEACKNAM